MNSSIAEGLDARDARAHSSVVVNDLTALTSKFLEASKRHSDLKREQTQHEARIRDLTENGSLNPANGDVNSLNKELLEMYQRKDNLTAEIADLNATISQITQQKEKIEREFGEVEAETKRHHDSFESLTEQSKELQSKKVRVEQELDAVTQQFLEQTTKMEDLKLTVKSHSDNITKCLAFIRENERFATHRALKNLITTKDVHTKGILGVKFGRCYESILTIGDDKKLCQWGLPALNELASFPVMAVPNSFTANKENGSIAVAGEDGMLRVLNMETGRIVISNKNHTAAATDVLWMSNIQVVSSSMDRVLKLFDVNRNTVVQTVGAYMTVASLCDTATQQVIAAGCLNQVRLYDMRTNKAVLSVEKVHGKQVTCIVPSTSKDSIFSLGLDGKVCESDIRKGAVVRRWESPELIVKYPLARFSIDPTGGYCAVGSENGSVLLFDMQSEKKPPIILKEHRAPVLCSAFAANMLVTGDKEHKLAFWG